MPTKLERKSKKAQQSFSEIDKIGLGQLPIRKRRNINKNQVNQAISSPILLNLSTNDLLYHIQDNKKHAEYQWSLGHAPSFIDSSSTSE